MVYLQPIILPGTLNLIAQGKLDPDSTEINIGDDRLNGLDAQRAGKFP